MFLFIYLIFFKSAKFNHIEKKIICSFHNLPKNIEFDSDMAMNQATLKYLSCYLRANYFLLFLLTIDYYIVVYYRILFPLLLVADLCSEFYVLHFFIMSVIGRVLSHMNHCIFFFIFQARSLFAVRTVWHLRILPRCSITSIVYNAKKSIRSFLSITR